MNRRLAVAAFLFAPCALSARADIAKKSTRQGREALAVRMWETSEAVVVARCPAGVRPDGGHEIVITKVLRGPLAVDGKLVLPKASVDVKDQIGRVVRTNDVVLEKDDTCVLFLTKGKNGAWALLPTSGWDGYADGDPRDMGYLWCGGTRVIKTLEECETFQTVSALASLGEKEAEARLAGVRVLMRYPDAWAAGTFNVVKLVRELGPELGTKALTGYLTEDVTEKEGPGWTLIALAIEWKVPAFLDWAQKKEPMAKPHGDPIAEVILFALGLPGNRPALLDRISSTWPQDTLGTPPSLDILVSLAAPDADAYFLKLFDGAARPTVVWPDLQRSLRYLKGRGRLLAADVQALILVVTSEKAAALHAQDILPAIEELERLTAKSFLGARRDVMTEAGQWKSWWEKSGREIAKYRPK